MSFFKKLKDRMFKSSSRLEEGLEAVVDAAPDLVAVDTTVAALPPAAGSGIVGRILGNPPAAPRRALDDQMLEQLEELLISAYMGVDTALRVVANLAEGRMGQRMSVPEVKSALAA